MSTTLVGDEAGLVGYWRFDDGMGDTAADATTSGNDGALEGSTASATPEWVTADWPVQ